MASPLPQSSATVHDAKSGFHDIKPLPAFSPFPFLIAGLLLLAATFIGLLIWWLKKKTLPAAPVLPPPPPHEVALREIEALNRKRERQEIDLRNLSTALSLSCRKYIESVFHFPATDQTTLEVLGNFSTELKRKLLNLPEDTRQQMLRKLEQILRLFSYFAFSTDAEKLFGLDDPRLQHAITETMSFIRDLAQQLEKETARTRSVTDISRGLDHAV